MRKYKGSMKVEIKIVLADDHPIVRKGLNDMIKEHSDLRVAAECADGREAITAIELHDPQVAVLDIDMPVLNGFETAREIKARKLKTEIIFLTMHRDEDIFNEAIDLGAKGFLLKESALENIVECIRTVAAGKEYASPALTTFLLNRTRRVLNLADDKPTIKNLTPTELRVIKLIAENLTNTEIGERLFVSRRTIEKHRENICRKLHLQGAHALYKYALTNKSKLL